MAPCYIMAGRLISLVYGLMIITDIVGKSNCLAENLPEELNSHIVESTNYVAEDLVSTQDSYNSSSQYSGRWNKTNHILRQSLQPSSSLLSSYDKDVWARKGQGAILPCPISDLRASDSLADVIWKRRNATISLDRRHSLTENGHLNITRVGGKSKGEYRCVVKSKDGILSGPTMFLHLASMKGSPMIFASNRTVSKGENVRLMCQIESEPSVNYTWTLNNQSLPHNPRYIYPNSGVLQIHNVIKEDQGAYQCIAKNELFEKSSTSSELEINVDEISVSFSPPRILNENIEYTVITGDSVIIECIANGNPLPSISWYHSAYDGDDKLKVKYEEGRIFLIGQGNLQINNIQPEDNGTYYCEALTSNPADGKTHNANATMELVVYSPPVIDIPPRSVHTDFLRKTRQDCSIVGVENPQITWYKDGNPIYDDGRLIQIRNDQLKLTFDVHMSGLYQCLYANEAGFVSGWAFIKNRNSKNQPPPPQNLNVTSLSPTSVILSWDPIPDVQAYSVHLEEKGSNSPTEVVVLPPLHKVTGLIPNTEYTFFARAYTSKISGKSEIFKFKTIEDIPSAVPEFTMYPNSSSTLIIQWKPLDARHAGGVIQSYMIRYQIVDGNYYYRVKEVFGGDTLETVLTNLLPGELYEVQVLAASGKGYPTKGGKEWPWTRIEMPKQNDVLKPATPTVVLKKISSNSTDGSSIEVIWDGPTKGVPINGYVLKYKRKNSTDWEKAIKFPPSIKSYVIHGIRNDEYVIEVRSFSKNGESEPSVHTSNQEIEKPITTTPKPFIPSIINLKKTCYETKISLYWNTDPQDIADVEYYSVKYKVLNNSGQNENYIRSKYKEVDITGLFPSTAYELSVGVKLQSSESEYFSAVLIGVTLEQALPPPPKQITSKVMNTSTIYLSWNAVNISGSRAHKYEVLYSLNQSIAHSNWNKKEIDGQNTQIEITGLVANTNYWFMVRSCSDSRCGEFSEPNPALINAILGPQHSEFLVIIGALLGCIFVIILAATAVFCFLRMRKTPIPRMHGCNGNGHVDGQRNGGVGDIQMSPLKSAIQKPSNGDEGEEPYVPMLTQIPNDFNNTPLDTKNTTGEECEKLVLTTLCSSTANKNISNGHNSLGVADRITDDESNRIGHDSFSGTEIPDWEIPVLSDLHRSSNSVPMGVQ